MPIDIIIPDVPESVRDELVARAALHGKTLQAFLRDELALLAWRQSTKPRLARLRERKKGSDVHLTDEEILGERDADRS